jgi:Fe-S-cluster-containing dehydrogenase component/anaerobic selenocysteine-containing dehydrogenase
MDKTTNGNTESGSRYWKSLTQYYHSADSDEAKAHEFMQGVTDDFSPSELSGMSRKQFLALLSASAAFAAAGCTNYRDKGEIVPYNKKPEEITLGRANYYASTCTACEHACGILIKTREGRPIKVDGNPEHPVSKGKICAKGQASILNLYDPERLREPMQKFAGMGFGKATWNQADNAVMSALLSAAQNGKEIAVITHSIQSQTTKNLLNDFAGKYPTTRVYSYEMLSDAPRQNAWKRSTGGEAFPLIAWEKARVIVALESDFLGTEGNTVEATRLYAQNRDTSDVKKFLRLYAIESRMSMTGMNADIRLRLRPDAQLEFVLSLIGEIVVKNRISPFAGSAAAAATAGRSLSAFAKKYSLPEDALQKLARDLIARRGEAIVYAGSTLPEEVHVTVNLLNEALGNTALYRTDQSVVAHAGLASREEWEGLIARMNNGGVAAVIHFDANPVYHLPSDYRYAEALQKVPISVALVEMQNETSAGSTFALPIHHAFESWNDFQTRTGVISLQQPVINPLYGSRQKEAALLVWMTGNPDAYKETLYHDYLRARWEKDVFARRATAVDFDAFWFAALHDGVLTFDEKSTPVPAARAEAITDIKSAEPAAPFVVVLHGGEYLGDGRHANNGWLQELANPVTKVVWDNYAAVSPATAKGLGVQNSDMIDLSHGDWKFTLPVFVQPGMADQVAAIALGYGRAVTGTVGSLVGFDAQKLLSKNGGLSPWIYTTLTAAKGSGTFELVTTQEYHSLTESREKDLHYKREIILEGTVAEFEENKNFIQEERIRKPISITEPVQYGDVKWAMSIDLNKCTGCGACTAACYAENNIPIVGKEQVRRGRDIAWIRIDRYFSGTPEDPTVSVQPMTCQHCDNAPCENVCPVVATSHSPDGLNQMAYNRCVGTRYCSNNCPFKVRRFNFYNFRNEFDDNIQQVPPLNMMYNPEVTVRSRGVMEKCTFCIQRIMEARQNAIAENRKIGGNEVVTACQQACPATAIVFGNVNDPDSHIAQAVKTELGYKVLEELNVRPNITYVARLKNV